MSQLKVLPDTAAVSQAAAELFIAASGESIERRGKFTVALAGGSTPAGAYKRLAAADNATRVNWRNAHFFWGDERCVPPDHPDSNYRMARDQLLVKVPVPRVNVHRIQGEAEPKSAAAAYVAELESVFGTEATPRFDLVLLGMGADGHTASLFPDSGALRELKRWVVAYHVAQLEAWRVTLTLRLLNEARQIVFLVTGSQKASRLAQVLAGDQEPGKNPAQLIAPRNGRLLWLIDQAAAAEL